MIIIRKNQLFAALIISSFCIAPVTAGACDVDDVPCLLDLEKGAPVQTVDPEAAVKESDVPDVKDETAKEDDGGESAAMTETDGYYQVDIENGDFYHFE